MSDPALIATVAEVRRVLDGHRGHGAKIGFVPTMGYLHEGHASLMAASVAANDVTVVSIFVNPLQFAASEDLGSYPRDLAHDVELAGANGVDLIFAPTVEEMYPGGRILTSVMVDELSLPWEGASRPTHFSGVATVVTKLFNIIGSCRGYFGEKDFQQLAVITRMVADLSLPIQIVGCPIIREPDGLAMSSRNVYLSVPERIAALVLKRALDEGAGLINDGERNASVVSTRMAAVVAGEPLAILDYSAAIDPATLREPQQLGLEARLVIAAQVGATRLLDNRGISTQASER